MTFRDLVVHVPVNPGTTCEVTVDAKTAPAINSVRIERDMRDIAKPVWFDVMLRSFEIKGGLLLHAVVTGKAVKA